MRRSRCSSSCWDIRGPPLRAASIRALSQADPEQFLLVLSGLGSDPDWRVRAAAAEGLGRATGEARRPTLTAMLSDADQRVVPAVLEALVAVEAPQAAALLLERLEVARRRRSRHGCAPAGRVATGGRRGRAGRRLRCSRARRVVSGAGGDCRGAGRVRRRRGAGHAAPGARGPGLGGPRPGGGATGAAGAGIEPPGRHRAGAGTAPGGLRRGPPDESERIAARLYRDGPAAPSRSSWRCWMLR